MATDDWNLHTRCALFLVGQNDQSSLLSFSGGRWGWGGGVTHCAALRGNQEEAKERQMFQILYWLPCSVCTVAETKVLATSGNTPPKCQSLFFKRHGGETEVHTQ